MKSGKRSGQMLQTISSAFQRLLVAEGDRRRVRTELHGPEPEVKRIRLAQNHETNEGRRQTVGPLVSYPTAQHSTPCSSSAAESPHARQAPARRLQLRVPSSGDGWAAFTDTVPISGGRIEDPTPLRRPHLVFCHVIAGAWNVRLTILFDQDGVAREPPPLLSNAPFLRVCLGHAAIRRAGAPHADDVVASLAALFFHVTKCHIRECAAHP